MTIERFACGGAMIAALEVEQIFPRKRIVVPLADFPAWFARGYCINPADGAHCDVMRAQWEGRDYSSWAENRWRTDSDGNVTVVMIFQNGNLIARFAPARAQELAAR
jgi:hypothetical protein